MKINDDHKLEMEHVRKLLKNCLSKCAAMNLDRLRAELSMDREIILDGLRSLVEEGKIEVLRPIGYQDVPDLGQVYEHFRLLRETDGAYLWEQELISRIPVTRLFDVRELEDEGIRASESQKRTSRFGSAFLKAARSLIC